MSKLSADAFTNGIVCKIMFSVFFFSLFDQVNNFFCGTFALTLDRIGLHSIDASVKLS